MPTKIDSIIDDEINVKLNSITIANGFTGDVSVLDGYMVHYANDLTNNENGLGFPCVAVQPDDDSVELSSSATKAKLGYKMKLIGAVSATDRDLIRPRLNELLLDVRKALTINTFVNKSLATDIRLGGAIFALPEKHEQYAYFEMQVTINYVEIFQ
jgi:hypothetical protein